MREFTVATVWADKPQDDCGGQWTICSRRTSANFSAVAFWFGKDLPGEPRGRADRADPQFRRRRADRGVHLDRGSEPYSGGWPGHRRQRATEFRSLAGSGKGQPWETGRTLQWQDPPPGEVPHPRGDLVPGGKQRRSGVHLPPTTAGDDRRLAEAWASPEMPFLIAELGRRDGERTDEPDDPGWRRFARSNTTPPRPCPACGCLRRWTWAWKRTSIRRTRKPSDIAWPCWRGSSSTSRICPSGRARR